MKKKPLGLMIVAASALAALAVGLGASDRAPREDPPAAYAAQSAEDPNS